MKMYVKAYTQRAISILATIAIVLASSFLSYELFHEKLNRVSGQLNSYNSADYSIIYILNYGEGFENECLYPDSDVQIYCDTDKTIRLAISSVMREEKTKYNLKYLAPLAHLMPGEACVSQNTADEYGLSVGDTLYAEYLYSTTSEPITITKVVQTEYDYGRPIINNNIGVVFLGFNEKYAANAKGKFILYAEKSRADELSLFPQIINKIINKSECISTVSSQGISALIFELLFAVVTVMLVHMVFFSKSPPLLYRCYLKGMKRVFTVVIPLMERLVLCLFPCALIQYMLTLNTPESSIGRGFRVIPVFISGLYCMAMLVLEILKQRRKGG